MSRDPTLRDIAELTGLSKSAVSQALRGLSSISAETRERVREAAAKLGYEPKAALVETMKRLRSPTKSAFRGTIAVVYSGHIKWNTLKATHRNVRQQWAGLESRARQYGYTLLHCVLEQGLRNAQAISRMLHARGVRGVIMFLGQELPCSEHAFFEDEFEVVFTGVFNPAWIRGVYVQKDSFQAGRECVRHAVFHGYKRIGIALHLMLDCEDRFISGCVHALKRCNLAQNLPVLRATDPHPEIVDWYRTHRPDCIISDMETPREALEQVGLYPPRDYGYIHSSLEYTQDPSLLAGFDACCERHGETAIDLLLGRLQGGCDQKRAWHTGISISGVWRPGPTLRRVSPAIASFSAEGSFSQAASGVQEPLDLTPCFNRPLSGMNSWFGGFPLPEIPSGVVEVAGVSLVLHAHEKTNGACLMRSSELTKRISAAWPREIQLPCSGSTVSIYLLAGCAYVIKNEHFADFEVTYADGTKNHTPLKVQFWAHKIQEGEACGQFFDWYNLIHLGNPTAKVVQIADFGGGDQALKPKLSLWEWRNPRPECDVSEVILRMHDQAATGFALLAATLVRPKSPDGAV